MRYMSVFYGQSLVTPPQPACQLSGSVWIRHPWLSLDPVFGNFSQLSEAGVDRILGAGKTTICLLDLCLLWLVRSISESIRRPLMVIIYLSNSLVVYPVYLKEAVVIPCLRKPLLEPSDLSNCCPIWYVPFLGKTIERVTVEQLYSILEYTLALNPYRSGFCPSYWR